jgi:hypothetical protein
LGQNSDFTSSILGWIKNGYEILLKTRESYDRKRVLNFYFLDKETDTLVCGTLQLSHDFSGREYPIVILVQMQGIEEQRDYEALWSRNLDILKNAKNVDELVDDLANYELLFKEKNLQELDTKVLAAFIKKDFTSFKQFYTPLQIDDFIEIMR